MAKHVGIVACSAEGAALCYRTICSEAPHIMGEHRHPEISMHTHPLADYMVHIRRGDWESVAELMLSSASKLAQVGADFAACPDNTIHQAFDFVKAKSPVPWLHIAETVGQEARTRGYRKLAVLGTKYLMTGPVYPEALKRFGMMCEIPDAAYVGLAFTSHLAGTAAASSFSAVTLTALVRGERPGGRAHGRRDGRPEAHQRRRGLEKIGDLNVSARFFGQSTGRAQENRPGQAENHQGQVADSGQEPGRTQKQHQEA